MTELSQILPTAREMYERDGYLLVPGLYDAALMLQWKDHIQKMLVESSTETNTHGVYVWSCQHLDDYFKRAMTDNRVSPILLAILGPAVEFLSVKTVFKNQTTTFGTPWHKDWFYWEGSPKISVWIALDDATPDNGCLQMIPGSHKTPLPHHEPDDDLGFSHRIDSKQIERLNLPVVDMKVQRGDAVFFSDQTVHGSYPNTAAGERWSFISTYRDATVPDTSVTWSDSIQLT